MSRFHLDLGLVLPAVLLQMLGLLVLRSVAPGLVAYQAVFVSVSLLVVVLLSLIDYQIIFSFYKLIYISSLIFLILPFIFGTLTRGSLRWIPIGQFSLQPSEIIKPLLIIVFSVLATKGGKHDLKYLLIAVLAPILVILGQPDLGTSLVILSSWLATLISRLYLKHILALVTVGTVLLAPVYSFVLRDYQRDRISTFINPYSDPLGSGYHVIQSIIAVGSGGFWGRGLGHGTQSQLRFLPEHHTDFIFASLSEELGFAGSSLVIILFLILLWRIYIISQHISDPAATIYCLAVSIMLTFQIIVNIGMNMGMVPVTGITLPFLSYGGSSLLSLGLTLGILNSISIKYRSSNYLLIG